MSGFMLCSCQKLYLKDVNSYYIYWEILHLPNFSNNKLLYIENVSSFFHHIKFMIFETVWSKKVWSKNYSAIVSHLFLLQIYTEWYILIGFSYNPKPVCFRAISMSFLNLLSQKTYPGEFSGPEVAWNRSYQRKSRT